MIMKATSQATKETLARLESLEAKMMHIMDMMGANDAALEQINNTLSLLQSGQAETEAGLQPRNLKNTIHAGCAIAIQTKEMKKAGASRTRWTPHHPPWNPSED